ncbi:MAG: hypothetical protein EOM83_00760 [Clostridia bacterium]|nr:hypothetical protein [Clostridia bacterium]
MKTLGRICKSMGLFWLLIGFALSAATQTISYVDDDLNLIVYDEAFLPFGFYCEAIPFDEYPDLAEQIASGGFNFLFAESYLKSPEELAEYLANYETFLQKCEAQQVRVVNGLLWQSVTPELFDLYINTFRQHAALVAWNLMDDANYMEISEVENQKNHLMALDHSRVTTTSFADIEPPVPYMLPFTDVALMQSYPWGLQGEGHNLDRSNFYFRNLVLDCNEKHIFPMATPQTYNWDNQTYPSAAHIDCQTYLAFVTGMKGILYYTFKDYDNNSTIDVTQPEVFGAASNVANEILQSEWKDVILHGLHEYHNIYQFKYYATWRYNSAFYLIAVNADAENNQQYEIPLPDDVAGEAVNFFPKRPDSLSVKNHRLSGELAPYQVAIYKMEIAK